jgi:hypothetical protein
MALGSAGLSGTGGSHDKYVPEIWSKRIQSAFETNTVAKAHCLDLSDLIRDMGGDIIHVPKLANRAAATRTLTSFAQVTPVGATEGEFTMDVQTWKIDPESVSDALSAQTKLFRLSQIDDKMQQSLAEAFDTSLFATYTDFTTTKGTDDGVTPASPDDIFNALEALDTAKCPKSDRVIILSPKTYWGFVKNNVIPSGDYTSNMAKESGRIPQIGGVSVVMSQNLPTAAGGSKVNLVLQREGIAFAIAQAARVRTDHDLSFLQTVIVGDMLYGAKVYRADAGVPVYGL